jgi:hypothetical protein
MIVHSFGTEDAGLADYQALLGLVRATHDLFGPTGEPGNLDALGTVSGVEVFSG